MPKPAHFTNYQHCCECAEHDTTLLTADVNSIGLEQLGNPGWDPLCFTSAEGLVYYMPALIRLTLETMSTPQERYLEQLLFHLIYDGTENRLVLNTALEQWCGLPPVSCRSNIGQIDTRVNRTNLKTMQFL